MFNSLDPSVRVQLLVCDYDGYIVGFRRQEKRVWGTWYRLRGEYMPTWLNPAEIRVSGNHSTETTVGGIDCIMHMFYALARSESDLAEIKATLLRAVVMFCEALRFLCILQMVIDAIVNNQDATPLPNHFWGRINNWGQLSRMALQVCKNGAVDSPTLLGRVMHRCQYFSFEEIIGDRTKGDLTLLMRNDEILLDRATWESLQEEGAGEDVHDPRF
ncbi:uncharacterized protein [Triticum aestivum]|uniref:uncharacterized protein n=1 Tax=Triticum aestivum TaxID=4565 RepID=UPI001D017A69|nr:uncharacterized protein LOC123086274 [Triticum aestivum]